MGAHNPHNTTTREGPSGPPLSAPLGTTHTTHVPHTLAVAWAPGFHPGTAHYGPTYARQPPLKNLEAPYLSHGLDRPRHIGRAREGQNRNVKQLGS